MDKILEGFWDCQYCGNTKIFGSKRVCPNCGHVRDEHTKFYLASDSKPINYKINENPDWICDYCDGQNSDSDDKCHWCGAERTFTEKNYFDKRNEEKIESIIDESTPTDIKNNIKAHTNINNNVQSPTNIKNNIKAHKPQFLNFEKIDKVWIQIFALICFIGIVIYLFIPKNINLHISEMMWERSITIEEYKTVEESGWSLPSNAVLKFSQKEFYAWESVLSHYETRTRQVTNQRISGYETIVTGHQDMGNGYFREITTQQPIYETYYTTETYQEPVYKDVAIEKIKYYYEIDKWVEKETFTETGNDKSPYWPTIICDKNEREGNKKELYSIMGIRKDNVKKYYVDYNIWKELNIDDNIDCKVVLDTIVEISKKNNSVLSK